MLLQNNVHNVYRITRTYETTNINGFINIYGKENITMKLTEQTADIKDIKHYKKYKLSYKVVACKFAAMCFDYNNRIVDIFYFETKKQAIDWKQVKLLDTYTNIQLVQIID